MRSKTIKVQLTKCAACREYTRECNYVDLWYKGKFLVCVESRKLRKISSLTIRVSKFVEPDGGYHEYQLFGKIVAFCEPGLKRVFGGIPAQFELIWTEAA